MPLPFSLIAAGTAVGVVQTRGQLVLQLVLLLLLSAATGWERSATRDQPTRSRDRVYAAYSLPNIEQSWQANVLLQVHRSSGIHTSAFVAYGLYNKGANVFKAHHIRAQARFRCLRVNHGRCSKVNGIQRSDSCYLRSRIRETKMIPMEVLINLKLLVIVLVMAKIVRKWRTLPSRELTAVGGQQTKQKEDYPTLKPEK